MHSRVGPVALACVHFTRCGTSGVRPGRSTMARRHLDDAHPTTSRSRSRSLRRRGRLVRDHVININLDIKARCSTKSVSCRPRRDPASKTLRKGPEQINISSRNHSSDDEDEAADDDGMRDRLDDDDDDDAEVTNDGPASPGAAQNAGASKQMTQHRQSRTGTRRDAGGRRGDNINTEAKQRYARRPAPPPKTARAQSITTAATTATDYQPSNRELMCILRSLATQMRGNHAE